MRPRHHTAENPAEGAVHIMQLGRFNEAAAACAPAAAAGPSPTRERAAATLIELQSTLRSVVQDVIQYALRPNYALIYMSIISLRLPDELEEKLTREAQLANRPRSEVARDAIAYYLDRLERERFLGSMESAARALAADPDSRGEALQMARDFLPLDNEALALGERRAEYELTPKRKTRKKNRKS